MDRITKSYLNEFVASVGLDNEKDETVKFEHFVNYTVLDSKTEERFDIEEVNIGKEKTLGIDGFALILNKQVINSIDELNEYLSKYKEVSAEIVFVQAKTSTSFEVKEIGNFGWAVLDFIREKPQIKWPKKAKEKIALLNALIGKSGAHVLRNNPSCHLFYVALGTNEDDVNVLTKTNEIKKDILHENLFSDVVLELIDARTLQSYYKRIGQAITRSFEFPARVTLPEIDGVKEAYLGIVDAKKIIHLLSDDQGELIPNVFYDNVRDFQGENKVNAEIKRTLASNDRMAFSILNNGITIVAESLIMTRNTFTISNYQIINGCQTSHVLFNNRSTIDERVQVPIKLICTKDVDLTAKVIRSTNRQTEVKEQDLLAFTDFQKGLEEYYGTFQGEQRLYYERRSKQYNSKDVEKKRIIDKTTQIKAIASFFFDKPDMATRFFGALFDEFGRKLFKDNHSKLPYYTAAYFLFRIDELLRRKVVDAKYKKIKYFLLMMLRYELQGDYCPPFESSKAERYCGECLRKVNIAGQLEKTFAEIIKKIDALKIDLSDSEISKSKTLVTQCVRQYKMK